MAYDMFISWVLENEEEVLRRRLINFERIFGQDFPIFQLNLFKYFVKSFGCRFVDAGVAVPEDLVALLPLEHFVTALKISFSVNEDLLVLPKDARAKFIAKGDISKWNCIDSEPSVGYNWDENISWFTVSYWYGTLPDGELGQPWIANSQFLYIGSFNPLAEEERANLISRYLNYKAQEQ